VETSDAKLAVAQSASGPQTFSACASSRCSRLLLFMATKVIAHNSTSPSKLAGSALLPLQACVQGHEEFAVRVAAMVDNREQEARFSRARKPEVAMVEVLWAPSHNSNELKIKEITKFVNTLIRTRGEALQYSEIEIGFMLVNFGLPRHRNGRGMVLRFSREICQRLHDLAVEFRMDPGNLLRLS
jgi:hypothetical protein